MHRHLTTPLPSENEEGTHHSRRLARNFAKLGLDDPEDFEINRDLAVASITNGYTRFNPKTPKPSEQPRFLLDPEYQCDQVTGECAWSNAAFREYKDYDCDPATEDCEMVLSDRLPFGDGPGVRSGCAKLTKDYWFGRGNPETMVDVNLCPVAVSIPTGCSFFILN